MTALRSLAFNAFFYVWVALVVILLIPVLPLPRRCHLAVIAFGVTGIRAGLAVLTGIRMEVRGREHIPPAPVLFAAKHQSAWDTMALHDLCGFPAVVMKRELRWIPLFGWIAVALHSIPIDRTGGAKTIRSLIAQARAAAAAGRSVLIFPQGTRVEPGTRAPYQPGTAALYLQLGLPCVPMALNSGCFWPRRKFLRRPGTIIVEFLPAIPPGLPRARFMARLEDAIETAADRLYAEATKAP